MAQSGIACKTFSVGKSSPFVSQRRSATVLDGNLLHADADDGDVLARLDKLATDAAAEHLAFARLQSQALPHALRCGQIINKARAAIPHGNTADWDGPSFQEWLDRAGIPLTTAKRYQRVDEHRDLLPDDPDEQATLGIAGAIYLIDLTLKENAPPWRDPVLARLEAIKEWQEANGIKVEDSPYQIPKWRQDEIDAARRALNQWARLRQTINKLTSGFKLYLGWEITQDIYASMIHGFDDDTFSQIDWSLDPKIIDDDAMLMGPASTLMDGDGI